MAPLESNDLGPSSGLNHKQNLSFEKGKLRQFFFVAVSVLGRVIMGKSSYCIYYYNVIIIIIVVDPAEEEDEDERRQRELLDAEERGEVARTSPPPGGPRGPRPRGADAAAQGGADVELCMGYLRLQ